MTSTAEFVDNVQAEVESFQKKINELEGRKTGIDKEIAQVRTEIKKRTDLLLVWEGKADVRPLVERRPRERTTRRGFTMNSIILDILGGADRPMTAHEILEGLVSRNAQGNSKNPISSVRNALQILKKRDLVVSPGYGLICLPGKESVGAPPKTIRRPASTGPEDADDN